MDTLSQVLVATVLDGARRRSRSACWAAESARVRKVMRPVLDVLQTLPQLVYIIPFIYLMPVSIVPGVIASVLYAAPVVIRLVERRRPGGLAATRSRRRTRSARRGCRCC